MDVLRPGVSLRSLAWLACAALAGAVPAQTLPAWTVLPVPGGVVSTGLRQIGKIVTYTELGQVNAYSAFSRRWVGLQTGTTATVRVCNDLALAIDGANYHAFSAYYGVWSSITLSATATVVNPSGQQNDSIWLVRDGADLWAFTAFRGTWVRLTVGSSPSIETERHVALVVDGNLLRAMSAYHGAWVTSPAVAPPTIARARGTAAVAASSGGVQGFSAMTNTWSSSPPPGPSPQLAIHDDVQLLSSSGNYLAFSGLRGTFATIGLPAVTLTLAETLIYATDNAGQHWAYSATRGAWTVLPTGAPATANIGGNGLILVLLDRVHAFSAMTGTVATALVPPVFATISRSVGTLLAQDGSIKLYSVLLGRWFDAPGGTSAEISDVAAFVRTPSGISAFSPRSGRLTPLAVSQAASTTIAIGNSVQAVIDNNVLHVFDSRRERWLTSPLSGTPTIGTHRTTLIVVDGTRAYGYGAFSGRVTQVTLPGPGSIVRPNSESASIEVANAIYTHTSTPDILTLWQFPEFRRAYVTGTPVEVQMQASNGTGFLFLGLSVLQNPTPILGLGDLELDPGSLLLLSGVPVAITQNHGSLRFPVPDVRALRGLELSFQGVVVPTAGAPYLTQSTSVWMY